MVIGLSSICSLSILENSPYFIRILHKNGIVKFSGHNVIYRIIYRIIKLYIERLNKS